MLVYVGPMLAHVGPMLSHLGGYVGHMFGDMLAKRTAQDYHTHTEITKTTQGSGPKT